MAKLVIKITVYQSLDPELYDSVCDLPLRRRAAVIRRLWREGLRPRSQTMETLQVGLPGAMPTERTVLTADQKKSGADGELLRKDLAAQGLSELSAFV